MKKSVVVWIHVLYWVITLFTFSRMSPIFLSQPGNSWWLIFPTILTQAIPLYAGYFVNPYLIRKATRSKYILYTIPFFIVPGFISVYENLTLLFDHQYIVLALMKYAGFTTLWILNFFIGFGFRSIFDLINQKKIQSNLEQQNLKTELALLRTQLNPHFLFNSLHNIDALIKKDPDQASEKLLKLSDIMRYMLYDSNVDQISLQKEVDHIENFMSLQAIRLKDRSVLEFRKEGNLSDVQIAPMILIPFVENIFKHYKPNPSESRIRISLIVEDRVLTFNCQNPYDSSDINKDETQGIGLDTVKRRLELIYPGKYTLHTSNQNAIYEVNLSLKLIHD